MGWRLGLSGPLTIEIRWNPRLRPQLNQERPREFARMYFDRLDVRALVRLRRIRRERFGPTREDRQFELALQIADRLRQGPNPTESLLALIRFLGRAFQYDTINRGLFDDSPGPEHLMDLHTICNELGLRSAEGSEEVSLASDLVLPRPWHPERLLTQLSNLSCRPEGPPPQEAWQYDRSNHYLKLWLPMRMVEVSGGNHSITAGVLSGTGKLPATRILDLTPAYRELELTATEIRRRADGSFVGPVWCWRMAAIFEVGRRLRMPEDSSQVSSPKKLYPFRDTWPDLVLGRRWFGRRR